MQDVWIVAPDKADERARMAMAALVTAMSRQDHLVSCPAVAAPSHAPQQCAHAGSSPSVDAAGRQSLLLAKYWLQRSRVADTQLAIVRFVPRDTSQPTVFAGSPLPPAPDRPGCLLLNKLPFQVLRSTGTLLMPRCGRGSQAANGTA